MSKLKYLRGVKDPSIAKEKFDNISNIQLKLSHEKWVKYIDMHQDYYTWYENTEDGIFEKNNMDKVPESFREKVLYSLNKTKVLAEYNTKKGYYEIVINFNDRLNVIGTTFMKRIKKEHLRRLLDLANYLDAFLLNNGKTIIDEKVIESLE